MSDAISSSDLPEVKYKKFNHEWDELPIRANGAAMALYITVATTLVSSKLLHPSTSLIIPCAIYFIGLLLAFVTHAIHFTLDADMDQKERISNGFTWIASLRKLPNLPQQLKTEADVLVVQLNTMREKLFTAPAILRLKVWSVDTYFLSLFCFLGASILVFVYFWLYLSGQS